MAAGASVLQLVLMAAVGVVFLVIAWKIFANLVKALFWVGVFVLFVAALVYFSKGQF